MKRTVRENIIAPYSLHDMNVIEFQLQDKNLIMKTQSGIVRTEGLITQVDGWVEFQNVDWDFCYIYLLDNTGNVGHFHGEKMMLRDFIEQIPVFGFSVMDEVYGYNQTKYMGYMKYQRQFKECIIEIYHLGNMIFVEK